MSSGELPRSATGLFLVQVSPGMVPEHEKQEETTRKFSQQLQPNDSERPQVSTDGSLRLSGGSLFPEIICS